ncbi:hypothetical protein CIK73_13925 [Brachybacterium alimentarium]|uniref:Alpha-1,2-fucosyltransferase n=1 Tax=Brachybacterium alimentarium TaxID=47845 RepID=A0A2A3YKA9_9MICO|nr:hypothetical protein CIK66_06985 [Brachybacterium alimentarium]RCS64904.1 hypothetical protein CIK73_13925 [Brachybacterium alimentarium]RCS71589.1 hypothetical protein CIK68_09255 [Brachybacterium alimentarium]RCS82427.1 hypothetical protein CIK67_13870 [Brachybacterium alimentarium]
MITGTARRLLEAARARPGAPTVQFTPDAVRGGNILYYWQWAYLGQLAGDRRSVLRTDHMDAWLEEFPVLESLTVSRADVSPLDQRAFATRHHFGSSFTAEENRLFSRWLLDGSPSFESRVEAARRVITDRTCVINVRRGDYYRVPEFRAEFGMDIRAHVSQAVEILVRSGRAPEDVLIVSDDLGWCRDNLQDTLPGGYRSLPHRTSLFDDLAALVASRTLVLANSTFSYWGSHLAAALRDDHVAVAPPYHQRVAAGPPVDDLFDPRWERTSLPADSEGPA